MSKKFKSIDRGGRSIRYVCMGAGVPAVIIDQGQGLSIERSFEREVPIGWTRVFTKIQESVQVLMHDRAGLGSSDPAPAPRTSVQMIDDLRAALAAAQVPPPHVLVGHSVGGFNVRGFAGRYPDEVAGMVLVDSSHPDQISRWAKIVPPETPGEPLPVRLLRHGPDATLRLSSNSTHLVAAHAGHMVQLEEPDLVIAAILRVVRAVQPGVRRLH